MDYCWTETTVRELVESGVQFGSPLHFDSHLKNEVFSGLVTAYKYTRATGMYVFHLGGLCFYASPEDLISYFVEVTED